MRERGRERAAGGWLATLAGGLILVVVGFGVGLLAGSLFEDPELVAKQLAGEATEVPLPEAVPAPGPPPARAPAPAAPDVAAGETPSDFEAGDEAEAEDEAGRRAAAATPGAAARPDAAKPGEAARSGAQAPPPEEPPPVATRPPAEPEPAPTPAREGFAVQVGAFADRAAADRLVASLRGDRFPAYVAQGQPGEAARFRVRVGPFPTRDEASRHAGRLKERRRLPTWVIREGGP